MHKTIAILGAGSWGTALALHLSKSESPVRLWDHDSTHLMTIKKNKQNSKYLPGILLPENIEYIESLKQAIENVTDILIAVPSFAFSDVIQNIKPYLSNNARIMSVTKGLDPLTNQLLSDIVLTHLPNHPVAVLSGPTFATEVARELPTAIVVATTQDAFAKDIVGRFNHHAFRVYTSTDLIGVQLGGAVKNVMAIAVGISDGLHYGANARSALITRGLAEMMRLGLAMGAKQETFVGLSGLGDLVLTCTDDQSRNRRFGLAIAKNQDINVAEKTIGQVVEGAHTVKQVIALAQQYQVDMPICQQVYAILNHETDIQSAVHHILSREPKMESNATF
jgi:glycerol-3-phosphate dehydrogenase (NAD(P)+)